MTTGAESNVSSSAKGVRDGRDIRRKCPRSKHAAWSPSKDRRDPIEVMIEQEKTRVAELLPLRHARMAASPFAFYRGAAEIMAADLAKTPTSGITVQACGDAHLSNFGGYAAPDRRLVFDVNDFDETLPAPWEWDLKRLVASFAIAGRDLGLKEDKRAELVLRCARTYRQAMLRMAGMGTLDVWYLRVDVEQALARLKEEHPKIIRKERSNFQAADPKDNLRALGKLTRKTSDGYRFKEKPPLLVPANRLSPMADGRRVESVVERVIDEYRATLPEDRKRLLDQFTVVDVARKVVGVGSVGTRAWVVLMTGRDDSDPLFLQVKQAQASVLEEFAGPSAFDHAGQRVVEGQRMMQTATDIFLGWCRVDDAQGNPIDYYVRQLWDSKASVDINQMTFKALRIYAQLCGATLARAHARSGDREGIAGYLGDSDVFDTAMVPFAESYAEQNAKDHKALLAAIADGRLTCSDEGA